MKKLVFLFAFFAGCFVCSAQNTLVISKITSEQNVIKSQKNIKVDYDKEGYITYLNNGNRTITGEHSDGVYKIAYTDDVTSYEIILNETDNGWNVTSDGETISTLVCKAERFESKIGDDVSSVVLNAMNIIVEMNGIKNNMYITTSEGIIAEYTNRGLGDIAYSYMNNQYVINHQHGFIKDKYTVTNPFNIESWKVRAALYPVIERSGVEQFILPLLFGLGIPEVIYRAQSYASTIDGKFPPENLGSKTGAPWITQSPVNETLNIETKLPVGTTLRLINGYIDPSRFDLYLKNSRLKTAVLTNLDTGLSKEIVFKDTSNEQTISIEKLGMGCHWQIKILDCYNGSKYRDLCVDYMAIN